MAFTFLKALGRETGRSPVEIDLVVTAKEILAEAAHRKVELVLPDDLVIATYPEDCTRIRQCSADRIPIAMNGLDIGPLTVARFRLALRDAATVVWNGPVGMFERPAFASGTMELAKIVAAHPGLTVAAGNDTAAAVRQAGVADRIGYLSTAGTAFLEALEGRELPGLAALTDTCSARHGATPS